MSEMMDVNVVQPDEELILYILLRFGLAIEWDAFWCNWKNPHDTHTHSPQQLHIYLFIYTHTHTHTHMNLSTTMCEREDTMILFFALSHSEMKCLRVCMYVCVLDEAWSTRNLVSENCRCFGRQALIR